MHDIQRYLVEEFADDYLEGTISRRDLLRRVLLMTGSVAVTATALSGLGVRSAKAQPVVEPRQPARTGSTPAQPAVLPDLPDVNGTMPPPAPTMDNVVSPDDPAILAGMVTFPGPAGDIYGYLAQPSAAGTFPGIVLIHENPGLIEPNLDIARRYAKEGYVALAVDLVSRAGGTSRYLDDLAQATGFLGAAQPEDLTADLLSGLDYLATLSVVDASRLAATGFCFGGGYAWRMATAAPRLRAVVPYYGTNPPLDQVPNINAAVLGVYAELDTRVTGASGVLDDALDAAGKTHTKYIALEANHAFFNNTGAGYNPAGAMEAWSRTLDWFATYLS